jgi:hypothetical protein
MELFWTVILLFCSHLIAFSCGCWYTKKKYNTLIDWILVNIFELISENTLESLEKAKWYINLLLKCKL